MTADPATRLHRFVDDLVAEDAVTDRWADAFRALPRHLFLPDTVYRHDPDRRGRDLVPVRRSDDPDGWLDLVYRDDLVVTQVDDGSPAADGIGHQASSSSSCPAVVADMLAALDPHPGERILEIGTGTGWSAALLAHAVGAEGVTTIEIDPAVAAHARAALDAAGCAGVRTVVGDGALGHPDDAPYDRIIATVGARSVPWAWVEQVAPGGRIVVPLTNTYRSPGILVLTRHGDGAATGRLGGPAMFMQMRAGRTDRLDTAGFTDGGADHLSTTTLHPYRVVGDRAAAIAIGFQLPDVSWAWAPDGDLGCLWMYAVEPRSWATVELLDDPPYPVEQAGPRRLWDEITSAHRSWVESGSPGVGDWLVSVDRDGQRWTVSP